MSAPHTIDLRSDTVTQPTVEMREAMFRCAVGDDVLGEDPTLNALEARAAELLGKEAALFVPSGTFSNQCAILTHTRSGNEVLLAENAHIVQHEAGASAILSRVQLRCIAPANQAWLMPEDLLPRIRVGEDIHYPKTGLICLEQATANGRLYPMDVLRAIREMSKACGIPIHIDGARLFNAAAALGVDPRELAENADSISICLSKGLCAPVGSLLVGGADFIARARKNRKIMGGGMRQAGFLGAAGLIALDKMRLRLSEDHANAARFAEKLAALPQIEISAKPEIGLVFMAIRHDGLTDAQFVARLQERGVLTYPPEGGDYRFVFHHDVSAEDADRAADIIADLLK